MHIRPIFRQLLTNEPQTLRASPSASRTRTGDCTEGATDILLSAEQDEIDRETIHDEVNAYNIYRKQHSSASSKHKQAFQEVSNLLDPSKHQPDKASHDQGRAQALARTRKTRTRLTAVAMKLCGAAGSGGIVSPVYTFHALYPATTADEHRKESAICGLTRSSTSLLGSDSSDGAQPDCVSRGRRRLHCATRRGAGGPRGRRGAPAARRRACCGAREPPTETQLLLRKKPDGSSGAAKAGRPGHLASSIFACPFSGNGLFLPSSAPAS